MQAPCKTEERAPIVNTVSTKAGRLRPVCEFCHKVGRVAFDVFPGAGWSVAPYPPDYVHDDGSTGDLFQCPACRRRMEREGSLKVHPLRQTARRARGQEVDR